MNYLEIFFNGVLKQSVPITGDIISIGRASTNNVIIDNMGVSSHHAIISKQENIYFIEDMNSTNGTFLNSQKIASKQRISSQDSIIIGKHTLKFSEWGKTQQSALSSDNKDLQDQTVMVDKNAISEISQPSSSLPHEQTQHYLVVRGDIHGVSKLLLTENNYGIGKANDNKIRLNGWFTPAHIAEIEKVGHSFYLNPLKKNKVKLNDKVINSSSLLSPMDRINIKNVFIKFLTD